ncbi:MAG: hypothetical protein ACP5M9_00765 [Candidatus Micrarchaeia archaeon]
MKTMNKNSFWHGIDHNKIHWLRFSLAFFALLNVASHLFASPGTTNTITFWLETEVAFYLIISVIYLLGLRMWYGAAVFYSILNLVIFFSSAFIIMPGITTQLLIGHIQFLQYSYGRGISLFAWLYLIIFGIVALKYDKGSDINKILRES